MAYTPFRYRRDEFDMDRERAEEAADAAQAKADADVRNRPLTQVELDAQAMKAREDAEDMKWLPIGITREQAIRRGWIQE
jgi:hypothetical protein